MRPERPLLRTLHLLALGVAGVVPASVAFAQSTATTHGHGPLDPLHMLATGAYGLIGIVLVVVGFKIFSAVMPFSVKKELEEDHNLAVGVLMAALVLGICIVVAATIHS